MNQTYIYNDVKSLC